MELEELKEIIKKAWQSVKKNNREILAQGIHEQTISAHLFCELRSDKDLKGGIWHIDVEYNRTGEEGKAKEIPPNKKAKLIRLRPDIIIHKRAHRHQKDNLLWIEIKKEGSGTNMDVYKCKKVTSREGEFQYQHALLLIYNSRGCLLYTSPSPRD